MGTGGNGQSKLFCSASNQNIIVTLKTSSAEVTACLFLRAFGREENGQGRFEIRILAC